MKTLYLLNYWYIEEIKFMANMKAHRSEEGIKNEFISKTNYSLQLQLTFLIIFWCKIKEV